MSELKFTPLGEIDAIHARLHDGFRSGKSRDIGYRKYLLLQLAYMLRDNSKRFEDAFAADLGRPPLEARFLEIDASIGQALNAWANVEKWAKPERPPFSLNGFPMRPVIYKEPKGAVLVISPFNYPVWISFSGVVGAIAAGNTVLLKPSEMTPRTSSLYAELVPQYFDSDVFAIVNGGIPETTKLLDLPWAHILFTGNGRVGRIVSEAAAKHLTPVSLELGGKSPVFIDPNCDLELAARRILWGKVVNAGQTCVAPDYVLIPRGIQDKFVGLLKDTMDKFYPESAASPGAFSRLVSPQAFKRVKGLLDNTKGNVAIGGEADEDAKFIAPTVVKDVGPGDSLMREEIFGPVLPIFPVNDVDEAIAYVNQHDHPLALYVFSNDDAYKKKVFSATQSGSAIANEVLLHLGIDGLPFGGIGPSGSGYHTGKYSFDMFTHLRSSMDAPGWTDKILGFRFPPYTSKSLKGASRLAKSLPPRPTGPPVIGSYTRTQWWRKWVYVALVVALVSGALTKGRTRPFSIFDPLPTIRRA